MKEESFISKSIFYDVIVIVGGLIGCFAARNLTRYNLRVALLEKREDLCTGISRANTAIVYSGCDTKPGTVKTTMCVKSAQGFQQLCDELGVRYSPCGSIMVSFGERGAKVLRNKFEQGATNGVRNMRLLTRDEVLELEPNIAGNVYAGLYVPDTGTVMPWELGLAVAENAVSNGAEIFLNTEVTGIGRPGGEHPGGEFSINTDKGAFFARGIVNCAGMASDSVLGMVSEPTVRIRHSAGDYFVLDTKLAGQISHVIFHEPEVKGKGLTLVPTVDGNILVGPTERPGDDFTTSHAGLDELRELVALVIPSLSLEHVIRSFGAVRPSSYRVARSVAQSAIYNVHNVQFSNGCYVEASQKSGLRAMHSVGTGFDIEDESINDFCIIESAGGAVISFVGVKTPGLTCADELGLHAAEKLASFLGVADNPGYSPYRSTPVRLSGMTFEEREIFLRRADPVYSRIICRCRGVSEGEIIDAIRRFPGATTLDGVKRRVGAGSGRCQGGFCAQRVIEILARELNCSPEEVTKDGDGSYVLGIRE